MENIQEAYRLRKIRHSDKNEAKMEMDLDLYNLLMGSNQIVHNRGRALAYLGGADRKRSRADMNAEGGGLDMNGPTGQRQRRDPYPKKQELRYNPPP